MISRTLEASPSVTHNAIERTLAGDLSYDALSTPDQAVVRGVWEEGIEARIDALDFTQQLREAGAPWAEADADGNVVHRSPQE